MKLVSTAVDLCMTLTRAMVDCPANVCMCLCVARSWERSAFSHGSGVMMWKRGFGVAFSPFGHSALCGDSGEESPLGQQCLGMYIVVVSPFTVNKTRCSSASESCVWVLLSRNTTVCHRCL